MDKNQLATIAITAGTTVVLREVFTWFVTFTRASVTKTVTKERARKVFSKRNLSYLLDWVWFVSCCSYLYAAMHETTPITRKDALVISIYVLAIFLSFTNLTWETLRLINEPSRERILAAIGRSQLGKEE